MITNSSFTNFIVENGLSLPFEFSYNGITDRSIVLGISAVNDETPSIEDVANFLDEVGNGSNYTVIVDQNKLAVCCDKTTAKSIIRSQTDLLKKTTVLRTDQDLGDFIDNLRYNEMLIREIDDSFVIE